MASSTLNANTLNANSATINTLNKRPTPLHLHGLTYSTVASATNITLAVNTITGVNFTGAAACTATLPAAVPGARLVYLQRDDPKGGTAALTFNCAGDDSFETGSAVQTTASEAVLYDISTAGDTNLSFTPTNDTKNIFSHGSTVTLQCVNSGKWYVTVNNIPDVGVTNGQVDGVWAFAA